jgi:hypothetical protein
MMTAAVAETKRGVTATIDELAHISKDTADTLRTLVAETFDRPYLDLDAVASLAESARMLYHLGDNTSTLYASALMLGELEDKSASLHAAAKEAGTTLDKFADLEAATERLSSTSPGLATLESMANRIEQAIESLDDYNPIIQVDDQQRWVYFKWGLGIGAFIVAAIVVSTVIYLHYG